MRCRATNEYAFQAWLLGILSLFSSLVGLGQTAFVIWLIIFSQSIAPILEVALVNAYYGYLAVAAFATLTGLIGCVGSLLRRLCFLIMYVMLLGGSMLFLIAVSVFIYIEQSKVSSELQTRIADNPDHYEAIDFHFNCRLGSNSTTTEEDNELEICSDFVLRQLWILVWAELGLSGFHVCLQFLLFVMAIMLIRLLKGECDSSNRIEPLRIVGARHRVRVPQERDSLEEETTSSTVPLFSTTSPITPSAPPLPGIPLSPIAPISLAPAHYNINTDNGGGGGTRRGSQEPKPRRQSLHYFNAGAQSPRSPGVGLPSSGATATSL